MEPHEPEIEAETESQRTRRELIGTIELIVTLVVVLAVIAFVVWFFFFAHNPLLRV
jgi:flagellar basal body-associated protein FliL